MAQEQTKNIGQIAAIWISSNSPENQKLVWYDTSERVHKVYDTASGEWVALNPQVVTNTTISYLQNIVQNSGLSVGKFYFLTDVGTLAIAITTTKVWYVDSHNNYIVNDLAASIQAYVNSTNLYIDGSTGVWNSSTGRLMFSFSTVAYGSNLNTGNDYIVMRRYSGSTWSWIKTKLANLISSVTGNSISWNSGLYFNFSNAINGIKNIAGGIVGYDQYQTNQKEIANQISNVSQGNQKILNTAKTYTDSKTSEYAMLNTAFGRPWTIYSNPPQTPSTGSTLYDVLSILISWAQILQNAEKIKMGSGFSSNGRSGNVNYSDTVRSAVEKLVYKINNQSNANGISLPSGFNVNGKAGDFFATDTLSDLLEKLIYQAKHVVCDIRNYMSAGAVLPQGKIYVYGIYPLECRVLRTGADELPTLVFANYRGTQTDEVSSFPYPSSLYVYIMADDSDKYTYNSSYSWKNAPAAYKELFKPTEKLPDDFNKDNYSGSVSAGDTLIDAIGKLAKNVGNLGSSVWGAKFEDDWYGAYITLGDEIGEFDSNGNALYSATLEGAVYLLAEWYSKHFHRYYNKTEPLLSLSGYHLEFNGSEDVQRNFTISYRRTENCIILVNPYHFNYEVLYDASDADDIDYGNLSSDFGLRLPEYILTILQQKFGYATPFSLNIPVTVIDGLQIQNTSQINNVASGMMYGVINQNYRIQETDTALKLVPLLTHATIGKVDNETTPESVSKGSGSVFNYDSSFGTSWLYNRAYFSHGSHTCVICIPPFQVQIPLF